jgi:predicted CopG family antitoxin
MKTITIREETYHKLSSLKEPGDSYSDVIDSLLKRKEMDLKKYFGCLKDSKVLDEIEAFSTESRRNTRMRI